MQPESWRGWGDGEPHIPSQWRSILPASASLAEPGSQHGGGPPVALGAQRRVSGVGAGAAGFAGH